MANFIELVCDCGKSLKVPKSRAGQTGKCARCGAAVAIPDVEPDLTGTSEYFLSSPRSDATAELPVEPSPQPAIEPAPPIMAEPPMRERRNTVPEAPRRPSHTQMHAVSPPQIPPTPQAQPVHQHHSSPPPGRQQEWQDAISSTPSLASTMRNISFQQPQPQKKKRKKKRQEVQAVRQTMVHPRTVSRRYDASKIAISTISLCCGIMIGVLLGPGYLAVIPAGLLPGFSREPSLDKELEGNDLSWESEGNTKVLEPSQGIGEPSIEVDPRQKIPTKVDQKLKQKLELAVQNSQVYLTSLQENISLLKANVDKLNEEYNVYLDREAQLVIQGKRREEYLQRHISGAKKVLSNERWDLMEKLYQYLKDFQVAPSKSQVIAEIKSTTKKLDERIRIYDEATTGGPKLAGDQMGKWYIYLKKLTGRLERLSNGNPPLEGGASFKLGAVQTEIRKINGYGRDIARAAKEMQDHINAGNNVQQWVRQRRKKIENYKQKTQLEILEEFLRKRKFDLDIRSEYRQLHGAVKALEKEEKRQVTKKTLSEALQPLQAIDRKYQDKYQDFNSAVLNFVVSTN